MHVQSTVTPPATVAPEFSEPRRAARPAAVDAMPPAGASPSIRNAWYIALPAAELRAKPVRREIEGEVIVLWRGADGRPRAIADRCAHRGMSLSEGTITEHCVRCPYHGWLWGGDGALAEVPSLPASAPVPRVRVRDYAVLEQDDHLWVWIGEAEPSGAPHRFPHHGEPGWRAFFMHTRFEASVDACLENFLDVPHTQFVHPGLFRGTAPTDTRVSVERTADRVTARFLDEQPLRGWGPRLVFPAGAAMGHSDAFLLPSTSRVDYTFGPDHAFIITSHCVCGADGGVEVTTHITWKLPLPGWIATPFLRRYCRRVITQDVELLQRHGAQLRRFGSAEVHTDADLLGRHITAMRRAAAQGRALPAATKIHTVRI